MSSGLQRRRVAGGGGGTSSSAEPQSSAATPEPQSENGSKIAYDPLDIASNKEELRSPKLTLMEEVLLMGLKDKQGYLSFWNDNISYALRGCILMELAFRGKIAMVNDPIRKRLSLSDRYIEVVDEKITGEALLDETVKIMKSSEPLSVGTWIDYLSGETWNLSKIGYQLKQVRERLAKGLVDKGVLRTEKRNFFLFDMATHPVSDSATKEEIKRRIIMYLTARTVVLPNTGLFPEDVAYRHLRSIALVAGSYAANVLENVLTNLSYDARDHALSRAEELLTDYAVFPFPTSTQPGGSGVGSNLAQEIHGEVEQHSDRELQIEVVAAV